MQGFAFASLILLTLGASGAAAKKPKAVQGMSPLDQYIQEVKQRAHATSVASPGSIFLATGRLADSARDVRASQVFDLVTIVVSDSASAISTGATNTSRKSSASAAVTSLAGVKSATGALANLANSSSNQQLQGQGTTSRTSTLTTTVTATVIDVLPNGNLVLEGQKDIVVNSEHQLVTVRGIVRPDDLSVTNSVASDKVGHLEVSVKGKGVVNDAVKRPFILYRLLLGLLPF